MTDDPPRTGRADADVIVVGSGFGGAVTALRLSEQGRPKDAFFDDPAWPAVPGGWRSELSAHYATAARMLGRETSPFSGEMDRHLHAAAEATGAGETYGPTPMAIWFGQEGRTVPDPFFDGAGPDRTGCRLCGACLVGCPYGSKNTLDLNYLWLAERRGAQIRAGQRVETVTALPGGGYEVALAGGGRLRALEVVLAAGVLGTLEILFRSRDAGLLPRVSPRLGERVRTNSEAITAVLADDRNADLSRGPTISSEFYPDARTHVTQNRYVGGWHMRLQLGPLIDGDDPARRRRDTLAHLARHPLRQARLMHAPRFLERLSVSAGSARRSRSGRSPASR